MRPTTPDSVCRVTTTQRDSRRFTATEKIGDVLCRITLEQDADGHYQEVDLTPLHSVDAGQPAG